MHHQAWRPSESGSRTDFERPLTGMEKYFALLQAATGSIPVSNGRFSFGLGPTITYQLPESITFDQFNTKLRKAWLKIRYDQPGLATLIDAKRYVRTYTVSSTQEEFDRWLADTFIIYNKPGDVDSLYSSLPPQPEYPSLWVFPASCQIMLRASHAVTDGLGSIRFFRLLFDMLDKADEELQAPSVGSWAEKVNDLPPSIEEILGTGEQGSDEEEKWARDTLMQYAMSQPASFGPPSTVGVSPPGACVCQDLVIEEMETETIIQDAKKAGISITAVLQAAWTLATMGHAAPSDKQDETYPAVYPMDLRKYMSPPYDGDEYSINLIYSPWILTTSLPQQNGDGPYRCTRGDFVRMAREIHNQLQTVLRDKTGTTI